MRKKHSYGLLFASIAACVLLLDQLTKYLVIRNFQLHQSVELIKNVLYLTYIRNTGAGFGILKNFNVLLIIVTIVVVFAVIFNYKKIPQKVQIQSFFSLIVGGAIGNLISRLWLGYVVDFVDFRIWPAFNVADSAITIGGIGLFFYFWKK